MYEKMGLREEGFFQALILPLLLTVILFLGPLSMQLFSGAWRIFIGMLNIHNYTICSKLIE